MIALGDKEEIVLTPVGYAELQEEYDRLRTVDRREIAERIRDAITYGELTENSEYEDASPQFDPLRRPADSLHLRTRSSR